MKKVGQKSHIFTDIIRPFLTHYPESLILWKARRLTLPRQASRTIR